eukprot:TRINITY_DN9674_c0_g3_i1.p1 TRINITY_DN9674_c0_g3~~TRINITY_DN9674_c0_g3_i1.p1  ORF type:complete len:702 (+),score=282.09 TRINITY_DN9674_c0_g3_i1:200-2305(+)
MSKVQESPKKGKASINERINDVKNRILFLSPSVVSGEDREWRKEDFESLNNSSLGVGGFGRVYKVKHKANKHIYAIKVIGKQKVIENDLVEQMKLEIKIMYQLNHPNIIKLYNHFEDNESFYLVMELAPKGQLYTKLKLLGRLDERQAAQYIREVTSAVMYLHSQNPPVIHRDIKPENILLDENESAKLCDFGWSNFYSKEKKRTTYCGTPEYLAPEMIRQTGHNESLDYWNIGVLCFELLTGKAPFEGETQKELLDNIVKVKVNYPKDFPKLAKDLIGRLLKSDPKERMAGEELMNHPWFKANPPYKKSTAGNGTSPKPKSSLLKKAEANHNGERFDQDSGLGSSSLEKDNVSPIIEKLTAKYKETNDAAAEMKSNYQAKVRELEAIKKENQELKDHLSKLGQEFTPQAAIEAKKMAEEVQKLKILNKDREEIFSELEEKSKVSQGHESRINILQNELEAHKRENESTSKRIKDLQDREEMLTKKYGALKEAYEQQSKEKEARTAELEGRLEMLHTKLISKTEDEGENKPDVMIDLVKTVLEEIREKIFPVEKAKKENDTLSEESLTVYNKLNELNSKYANEMFEVQTQYDKKLNELKAQLAEESREFAKKEEQKVESFRKQLGQEAGQRKNQQLSDKLQKGYEEQTKELNVLRSKMELNSKEIARRRGEIKGLNKRIEDLELEVGITKAKVFEILNGFE